MPAQSLHFRCPCCGQHAPIERILEEGPFEFQVFEKKLGGKLALTSEDRRRLRGQRSGRGKAAGILQYDEVRTLKEHRAAIDKRIKELSKG
jgi:hypothetical protein